MTRFAGIAMAAGLMVFAALQFNAQVIREDKINQEITKWHR